MVSRLEVRLDEERRRRLDEIARERDVPVSELVRRLIDDAWETITLERRLSAVRRITSVELDVPDDPADLCNELEERYEPPDLH